MTFLKRFGMKRKLFTNTEKFDAFIMSTFYFDDVLMLKPKQFNQIMSPATSLISGWRGISQTFVT